MPHPMMYEYYDCPHCGASDWNAKCDSWTNTLEIGFEEDGIHVEGMFLHPDDFNTSDWEFECRNCGLAFRIEEDEDDEDRKKIVVIRKPHKPKKAKGD